MDGLGFVTTKCKPVLIFLCVMIPLLAAGCLPDKVEMDSYQFGELAVIDFPKDWHVDDSDSTEAVRFLPFSVEEMNPSHTAQFIVNDASVGGYFTTDNQIDPHRLRTFVEEMGLKLVGPAWPTTVNNRQAYAQYFNDAKGVLSYDAHGFVAIVGEPNHLVFVMAIGSPDLWDKYEKVFTDVLYQITLLP